MRGNGTASGDTGIAGRLDRDRLDGGQIVLHAMVQFGDQQALLLARGDLRRDVATGAKDPLGPARLVEHDLARTPQPAGAVGAAMGDLVSALPRAFQCGGVGGQDRALSSA